MARKKQPQFVSQAALQALVRFGPELSGLKELQRTAEENAKTALAQAHVGAQGAVDQIDRVRPQIAGIYDQAGLQQAAVAGSLIGHDLAGLGPVADSIKAGAALEQAGAADRLGVAKTQALTDLGSRAVRAREGETFAANNTLRQLSSDLTKILGRKQDVRREKGAFEASVIGDLQGAQAARQFTARENRRNRQATHRENAANRTNAQVVAGVNPDGTIVPGGPKDKPPKVPAGARGALPGGVKLQPQSVHNTLSGKISSAQDAVGDFVKGAVKQGKSRAWINQQLARGIPGYTVHDPSTGRIKINPDGSPQTAPGLKPIGEIERNVVLDRLLYNGKVTSVTARKLHRMGYSVRKLGLQIGNPRKPSAYENAGQVVKRLVS